MLRLFFSDSLSNDRKRYNHPAISGRLPIPWLPAGKKSYIESVSAIQPSGVDLEQAQSDMDIDLTSSGAVLIDIKRRSTDFRNMTKRLAVKTAGGQLPPSSDPSSSTRHDRRSSTSRRLSDNCADPSFHDDSIMQSSASIWGRTAPNLLSKSPTSTVGREQDVGDSSEDDDEEEAAQRDRYTFYPHRRNGSTSSFASQEHEVGETDHESGDEHR